MAPDGGVEALNLKTGEPAWATKEAAKPVSVVGDAVVSQAPPAAGANALKVVTLDRATGKQVSSGTVDLPPGVRPMVQSTPHRTFTMAAAPSAGGEAVVTWQHTERPKRALPPGTKDVLPPPGGAGAPPVVGGPGDTRRGAFKLNLTTGATAPHEGPSPPVAMAPPLTPGRLPGVAGPQLPSADGTHVLARRTPDEPKKDANDPPGLPSRTMVVYDRATGQPAGEFRTPVQPVAFFVTDNRIVFETAPFSRPDTAPDKKGKLVEEPAMVRAVDLKTGKQVWARPVREAIDRNAAVPP
jgi:hypothetical protein